MKKITWEDFLERYINFGEEFLIWYGGKEYHLAFYEKENKTIAEFNIGTKENGYVNIEYSSATSLLENARIDGKSIHEMWDYLMVE